jgi:hypothetical protein
VQCARVLHVYSTRVSFWCTRLCASVYGIEEKRYLVLLAHMLGAQFTNSMKATNTHLLVGPRCACSLVACPRSDLRSRLQVHAPKKDANCGATSENQAAHRPTHAAWRFKIQQGGCTCLQVPRRVGNKYSQSGIHDVTPVVAAWLIDAAATGTVRCVGPLRLALVPKFVVTHPTIGCSDICPRTNLGYAYV